MQYTVNSIEYYSNPKLGWERLPRRGRRSQPSKILNSSRIAILEFRISETGV